MHRIYEGLGVSQDLTFCELNPDGYDHIIIGDKRVDFPKGKENLIEWLKSHFPHEAKGIDSYFANLTNMIASLSRIGKLTTFKCGDTKTAKNAKPLYFLCASLCALRLVFYTFCVLR